MERLENLVDEIFLFSMEETYREEIEKSRDLFSNVISDEIENIENGYNMWLVFDFKLENGNNFIEEYISVKGDLLNKEDLDLLDRLNKAVFSVFELMANNDKPFFKDIITNQDFVVSNISDWEASICKGRLVSMGEEYYLLEGYLTYQIGFKDIVKKGVLGKYNEYCSTVEPIDIVTFVKENSVIIYRLMDIIDSLLEDEKNDFSDMHVYQGIYVVKEFKSLLEAMNGSELCYLDDEHSGEYVYRFSGQNENLAEILITKQKLEIECNTDGDLDKSKVILDQIITDQVEFLKDEMLNMDALL